VSRALSSIAEPSRGRFIRSWVGTSRGEDGKTKLTFVWEPVPAPPGVRRENATAVNLIAASPDGETFFRGAVPSDASGSGNGGTDGSAASPSRSVSFDVPPGRVQLRVAVQGGDALLDTDDREVVAPDMTGAELLFGTPRVHIARNALEFRSLSKDPAAVPTADREFRRTDRLIIRTDVYAPGNAASQVTGKLLNKQGSSLADIPVTAPAGEGQPYVVDLPLASLAVGEYLLELTAKVGGAQDAVQLIPFRVSGS
jgi:hypothetical protein